MRNKILVALLLGAMSAVAAPSASHYKNIDGKSGSELWSAVGACAESGYKGLTYAEVWSAYQTTDMANGYIIDMYGNCSFTYKSDQCGNYNTECDCYNREHSIPKSWFGQSSAESYTIGTDLFHLVPTDGYVNAKRSNYPFGEVKTASYEYAGSKLGTSALSSYSGTVFEPQDEYKGDFARGYFGSIAKWWDNGVTFTTSYGLAMFSNSYTAAGHYGLTNYSIELLMKWHREDPVSDKERKRNDAIQSKQGNRNPFIDYPCLAEFFWGKMQGEKVDLQQLISSYDTAYTTDTTGGCGCKKEPFQALPATNVTTHSFVANWTGSYDTYRVDVWFKQEGKEGRTLLEQDFTTTQGNWEIQNEELPQGLTFVWKQDATYGMKASAFSNKTAYATQSNVVSPEVDMEDYQEVKLSILQALNKGAGNNLHVQIQVKDEWENISINMPAGTSWTFQTDTARLDPWGGNKAKIRFRYESTSTDCPTWEIKSITVEGIGQATTDKPVSGFPKSNVTGKSIEVTGLETATQYWYCITPDGENPSDTISVTTKQVTTVEETGYVREGLDKRKCLKHGELMIQVGEAWYDIWGRRRK